MSQVFGNGNVRVEYEHGLFEFPPKGVNCSGLIGISCYKHKTVGICAYDIYKGRDCEVHVGAFLLEFDDARHPSFS